jgi:hypothetical protein
MEEIGQKDVFEDSLPLVCEVVFEDGSRSTSAFEVPVWDKGSTNVVAVKLSISNVPRATAPSLRLVFK